MKIVKYILILIFVLFAAVQYNDPDVFLWIFVYLFPAFLIFRSFQNPGIESSFIYVAFVYLLWAINVFPPAWEGVLLNQAGMKTLNIELGRESLGLGFVAIVLGFVGFFTNKK